MPGMCKEQHRHRVARAKWARGKVEGDEVRKGWADCVGSCRSFGGFGGFYLALDGSPSGLFSL